MIAGLGYRSLPERGYGATVARLTPDQTVGRSNRSSLNYSCWSFVIVLVFNYVARLGDRHFGRVVKAPAC